jgi:hypothetical protein
MSQFVVLLHVIESDLASQLMYLGEGGEDGDLLLMVGEKPWKMRQHTEDEADARGDQQQLAVFRPGLCQPAGYHSGDLAAVFGEADHLLLDFLPVLHVEDFDLVSGARHCALEQILVDAKRVDIVEDSVGLDLLALGSDSARTHFLLVRGDMAQEAVGEPDDQVAVSEQTVVDHFAVFRLEHQLG